MARKTKKKLNLNYTLCNADKKNLATDVSEESYKTVEEAQTAAAAGEYRFIVIGTQMEGEPVGQIEESDTEAKFFDMQEEKKAKESDPLLGNTKALNVAKETVKKATGTRKPGVIAEIITILGEGQHTKKEIADKLAERFPDRDADKMLKTVNCQVPNRLRREKELVIMQRSGKYWIDADAEEAAE